MVLRGDIVLARFPFTDLTGATLRPALVVSHGNIGQDLILVGISSVVRGAVSPDDVAVETAHPEFGLTGLKVASVFRTHKLATVEQSVVQRRLGLVGPSLQAEIDSKLRNVMGL